ncbi:MAG: carboxypeptidase-like regulatory domain-containing protein [Pirellulales bacterium]
MPQLTGNSIWHDEANGSGAQSLRSWRPRSRVDRNHLRRMLLIVGCVLCSILTWQVLTAPFRQPRCHWLLIAPSEEVAPENESDVSIDVPRVWANAAVRKLSNRIAADNPAVPKIQNLSGDLDHYLAAESKTICDSSTVCVAISGVLRLDGNAAVLCSSSREAAHQGDGVDVALLVRRLQAVPCKQIVLVIDAITPAADGAHNAAVPIVLEQFRESLEREMLRDASSGKVAPTAIYLNVACAQELFDGERPVPMLTNAVADKIASPTTSHAEPIVSAIEPVLEQLRQRRARSLYPGIADRLVSAHWPVDSLLWSGHDSNLALDSEQVDSSKNPGSEAVQSNESSTASSDKIASDDLAKCLEALDAWSLPIPALEPEWLKFPVGDSQRDRMPIAARLFERFITKQEALAWFDSEAMQMDSLHALAQWIDDSVRAKPVRFLRPWMSELHSHAPDVPGKSFPSLISAVTLEQAGLIERSSLLKEEDRKLLTVIGSLCEPDMTEAAVGLQLKQLAPEQNRWLEIRIAGSIASKTEWPWELKRLRLKVELLGLRLASDPHLGTVSMKSLQIVDAALAQSDHASESQHQSDWIAVSIASLRRAEQAAGEAIDHCAAVHAAEHSVRQVIAEILRVRPWRMRSRSSNLEGDTAYRTLQAVLNVQQALSCSFDAPTEQLVDAETRLMRLHRQWKSEWQSAHYQNQIVLRPQRASEISLLQFLSTLQIASADDAECASSAQAMIERVRSQLASKETSLVQFANDLAEIRIASDQLIGRLRQKLQSMPDSVPADSPIWLLPVELNETREQPIFPADRHYLGRIQTITATHRKRESKLRQSLDSSLRVDHAVAYQSWNRLADALGVKASDETFSPESRPVYVKRDLPPMLRCEWMNGSASSHEVALFPNQDNAMSVRLCNIQANSQSVSLRLIAVDGIDGELPTGLLDEAVAAKACAQLRRPHLIAVVPSVIVESSDAVDVKFPAVAINPDEALVVVRHLVLEVQSLLDKRTQYCVWTPQIVRGSALISASLKVDADRRMVSLNVGLSESKTLPDSGVRVHMELTDRTSFQVLARIETVLHEGKVEDELQLSTARCRGPAWLRVSVMGEPDSIVYLLTPDSHGSLLPTPEVEAIRLHSDMPEVVVGPKQHSTTAVVETIVSDTAWDRRVDTIRIGLDRNGNRRTDDGLHVELHEPIERTVIFAGVDASGRVDLRTVSSRPRVEIPTDGAMDIRCEVIAEAERGGKKQWSSPLPVILDGRAPRIESVRVAASQPTLIGPPVEVLVHLNDEGLSGGGSVTGAWALSGEMRMHEKSVRVAAVKREQDRWLLAMQTVDMPTGPMPLLIEAVDRAGNVSETCCVTVDLATAAEIEAARRRLTTVVSGDVLFATKPLSGLNVALIPLPAKSGDASDPNATINKTAPVSTAMTDDQGLFRLMNVPTGDYQLEVSGIVRGMKAVRSQTIHVEAPVAPAMIHIRMDKPPADGESVGDKR